MSAKPSGSSGHPSASAMDGAWRSPAGVSWNDSNSPVSGGSPWSARRWLSTGPRWTRPATRSPVVAPPCPRPSRWRAAGRPPPDDFDCTPGEHALVAHRGLVAVVELAGELGEEIELLGRHRQVGHDAVAGVAEVGPGVLGRLPRWCRRRPAAPAPGARRGWCGSVESGSPGHCLPEREQGGHDARLQRRGEVGLGGLRPPVLHQRVPHGVGVGELAIAAARRWRPWRRRPDQGRSSRRRGSRTAAAIGGDGAGRGVGARTGGQRLGRVRDRRPPTARPGWPATPRTRRRRGRWRRRPCVPKNPAEADASPLRPTADSGSVSPTFSSRHSGCGAVAQVGPVGAGGVAEARPHVVAGAEVGDGVEAAGGRGHRRWGRWPAPAAPRGRRACGPSTTSTQAVEVTQASTSSATVPSAMAAAVAAGRLGAHLDVGAEGLALARARSSAHTTTAGLAARRRWARRRRRSPAGRAPRPPPWRPHRGLPAPAARVRQYRWVVARR